MPREELELQKALRLDDLRRNIARCRLGTPDLERLRDAYLLQHFGRCAQDEYLRVQAEFAVEVISVLEVRRAEDAARATKATAAPPASNPLWRLLQRVLRRRGSNDAA